MNIGLGTTCPACPGTVPEKGGTTGQDNHPPLGGLSRSLSHPRPVLKGRQTKNNSAGRDPGEDD